MRFALLGNHPDGLDMACALAATGRHELVAYSGPTAGVEALPGRGLAVKSVGDLEEVLADPAVELVIVAGRPGARALELRRALQSERHVLCVHPADDSPDIAYEAALIQADTKQLLLPLLPDSLQPAALRLAELVRSPEGPIGKLGLIVMEYTGDGSVLVDAGSPGFGPALPCWGILRRLGGEVAELSAFAAGAEVSGDEPILVSGRFESGGLFQVTLLPWQAAGRQVMRVHGTRGTAELASDVSVGSTTLTLHVPGRQSQTEVFANWDRWAALAERLESGLPNPQSASRNPQLLSWQDEVRALELDDAVRRSVERRRASALEYQQATEVVGFKGTMTLAGCALLWSLLVLVVLVAAWDDRRLLYLVVPVLVLFLGIQLLRWIIPEAEKGSPPSTHHPKTD